MDVHKNWRDNVDGALDKTRFSFQDQSRLVEQLNNKNETAHNEMQNLTNHVAEISNRIPDMNRLNQVLKKSS